VVGERPIKENAIARERSIEAITDRLHLHVISEHPLSRVNHRVELKRIENRPRTVLRMATACLDDKRNSLGARDAQDAR
jgi:hypothetical protein